MNVQFIKFEALLRGPFTNLQVGEFSQISTILHNSDSKKNQKFCISISILVVNMIYKYKQIVAIFRKKDF